MVLWNLKVTVLPCTTVKTKRAGGAKKHRPDGVVRKRLGDPVKLNKHVPLGCQNEV